MKMPTNSEYHINTESWRYIPGFYFFKTFNANT